MSTRAVRRSIWLAAAIFLFLAAETRAANLLVTETGDTPASAILLDGFFTPAADANVFGNLPTVTVLGGVNETVFDIDWYQITVSPGGTLYADIDLVVDPLFPDLALSLYDETGTLIAWGDDSAFTTPDADPMNQDPGSDSMLLPGSDPGTLDPFLGQLTIPSIGSYLLAVHDFLRQPSDIWFETAQFGTPLVPPGQGDTSTFSASVGEGGGFVIIGAAPGDLSFQGDFPAGSEGSLYTLHVTFAPLAVPEPTSVGLVLLGAVALAMRSFFRRRAH